jgi:competence protein ComEC
MPARTTSNSEADSSQALRRSGPFDVPVLQVTAALLMGIVLREYVDVPGWLFPVASVLVLLAASVLVYRRCHWGARFTIIVLFLLIGAIRWQIREDSGQHSALLHLRQQDDTPVSLTARIDSVPVVHDRPESSLSQRSFGSRQQTRFLVSAISVDVPGQVMPIEGHCQVYVDGDASNACHSGDVVRLLGHTGWPDAPGNPGEFDFPTYLRRKGISALLYVKHPHAIAIVESGGWSSPGYWLTVLRSQARTSIVRHVDPEVRSIAMALLLGDRNELTDETEQAFISSGAMHLLAISGLHVGIMWLFAMRFLNLLFVPRNRALVIVAVLCIVYAMMTDLRPSVVRATVFFVLITIAELSRRNVRMVSVLATAAFLMLLWQPWLAFNSGAWLSFLSVAALCCIDAGRMNTDRDRAAPSDSITVKEKLLRYRDVCGTVSLCACGRC